MSLAATLLALAAAVHPAGLLAEIPTEVRARIEALRADSQPGDPARVEVARAALQAGLLAEFVAELDRVLGRDPDLAAARELVAQAPLSLTLPAEAGRTRERRLVLFGARAQPAYRELAASLASPSPNVRAFAALALRRLDPRAQADALVQRAVLDPSEVVRVEAARALRDARQESLLGRVAAALVHESAPLRVNAASALGEMGQAAALAPLVARLAALQSGGHAGGTRAHLAITNQVAYVKDFDPQIAQGASIADPVVDTVTAGTVLDVRVVTSTQRAPGVSPAAEKRALCDALRRVSDVDLPDDPARWLAWWDAREAR